jgi:hypothetical protein
MAKRPVRQAAVPQSTDEQPDSSASRDLLPGRLGLPGPVVAIVLGVPLLLLGAVSLVRLELAPGEVYSGVFRYDLFYYLAHAREVVENGNGLFYATPFSASFDGPLVYSHLQLGLFGWLWWGTGISLPVLWQLGQLIFGSLMFLALYHLLGCFFRGRELTRAFVVISLGGGTLAIHALLLWSVAEGPSFLETFHYLKAGQKGPAWFPNVFQNALFTTEAFYHVLAFTTFAAAIRGRTTLALVTIFLTWWAHPFTGLEVGAIVGAWALLEALVTRKQESVALASGVFVISVCFLVYNIFLIPSWSIDSADVMARWRHEKMLLELIDAPAMWGVFLVGPCLLAVRRLRLVDLRESPRDRFIIVWLVVVAALLLHDRFLPSSMPAYQPLHFARGYLFVPMAILLLRGLPQLAPSWTPLRKKLVLGVLGLVVFADNVVYTADAALWRPMPLLSADSAAVSDYLAQQETPALVLVDGRVPILPKYLAMMTPHKLYLLNSVMTPFYEQKVAAVRAAAASDSPARELARLGISYAVGEQLAEESFATDIGAGRARLAFEHGAYQVVEVLLPPAPQPPGPPPAPAR